MLRKWLQRLRRLADGKGVKNAASEGRGTAFFKAPSRQFLSHNCRTRLRGGPSLQTPFNRPQDELSNGVISKCLTRVCPREKCITSSCAGDPRHHYACTVRTAQRWTMARACFSLIYYFLRGGKGGGEADSDLLARRRLCRKTLHDSPGQALAIISP